MAVERRNPLPKGVYWVDVFGEDREPFNEWLSQSGVGVLKSKAYTDPPGEWVLFQVTAPVAWNGPGFPTIARRDTEQEDTVQRPPPPDFDDVFNGDGLSFGTKVVIGGVALGLGIYLIRKL